MSTTNPIESVREILHREASLLDQKRWDEWLALYEAEACYWIPAWDDDGALIEDPKREISLMYYSSRRGLEDRVSRIRSGQSSASVPLPRTCHMLSGVRVTGGDAEELVAETSFTVHSFRKAKTETFFGAYEHRLRRRGDVLTIARKKITLLNDVIPGLLDVYSV